VTGGNRHPPPWAWERVSAEQRRLRWQDLMQWVEWLRRTHEDMVRLPDCWPHHLHLRSELAMFRYWHMRAFEMMRDPSEGTRWYQSLAVSAERWRELATCEHEAPLGFEEMALRDREATVKSFVDAVVDETVLMLPDGGTPPEPNDG
jgi:hypothetical protein